MVEKSLCLLLNFVTGIRSKVGLLVPWLNRSRAREKSVTEREAELQLSLASLSSHFLFLALEPSAGLDSFLSGESIIASLLASQLFGYKKNSVGFLLI